MRHWLVFGLVLILGCASTQNQNDLSSQNNQNQKKAKKEQKKQYPDFVRYFQNRVSVAVRDEGAFDSEDQIEWRRFQKGVELCDAAFLVEVKDVVPKPDRSAYWVECEIVEPIILRNKAAQGLQIQLEVKDPNTEFQLPAEALKGEKYILLVKLDKKKQISGGEYYTAWWQVYPTADKVLDLLEQHSK